MNRRDLLALFLSAPISLPSQAAQAPSGKPGKELVQRMQEALGGSEKLAAIRDVDWTVVARTWNRSGTPGPDVERRTRWIRPNVFRKDQRAGNIVIQYFFDGEGGWELVPEAGLIELEGRELEFVSGEANDTYPRKWLPDRDPSLRVTSGGPDVIRVLKGGGRSGSDIVVDLETSLPLRIVGTTLSGEVGTTYRRLPQRLEFVQWRTVAGIKWPQRLVNFHDDVKMAEITTTQIGIDVGLDLDDLARRPQAE